MPRLSDEPGVVSWRLIMLIASAAMLAVAAGGASFYRSQERQLRSQAEDQLASIARLKVDQIAAWRRDRVADGRRAIEGPGLAALIAQWQADPTPEVTEQLKQALRAQMYGDRYRDARLVSVDGEVLMHAAGRDEALNPIAVRAVKAALASREVTLTELHMDEAEESPHLDVVSPFYEGDAAGARPLGAVVLHADVSDFLYPLVQLWPTPSETAETLLVRRDGDAALFISDVRHASDAALRLRVPLTRTDVPGVQAVLGRVGIFEGVDYRGHKVLSFLAKVPDSGWCMVAKVDASEAFAEWRERARFIILLVLLGAGGVGGSILLFWQRLRARALRELLAAEQGRAVAEERFRVTLSSVGDAVISADAECDVVFMNPIAEQLTGWSNEEAKGRPLDEVFSIINEQTREPVESPAVRAMRDGVIVGLANHTVLVARDGSERAIADSGAPVRDSSGEISGVVLVFRDQTEERTAARALEESEARFRTLVEGAPDAIFVQTDMKFAYLNEAACTLYGAASCDELLGTPVMERFHPSMHELIRGRLDDLLATQMSQPAIEQTHLRLDGSEIRVEVSAVPVNYDGVDGVLVFVRDMTDRLAAESAARESEELMRIAGDLARLGGWTVDLVEGRVHWSHAVAQIHGMPVGYSPTIEEGISFYAPECRERIAKVFAECATQGIPYDEELQIITPEGRRVWVHTIGVPVRDAAGSIVGVHGGFQDISERKATDAELESYRWHLEELVAERTKDLERANRRLEEATLAKSRFLANMSHELRTPMNAIIGFSGLLAQGMTGPLSPEQQEQVTLIYNSGKHLLELINEVLDLSKIEAGRTEVLRTDFDAAEVVREVAETLSHLAAEKGLRLAVDLPDGPLEISTDVGKLRQILVNLAGNALKFTREGSVVLGLARNPSGMTEFTVTDTGPGIPADDQARIFEAFTQLEHPDYAKIEGTGLGLTVSREYASLMGGTITVKGNDGKGSVFTLTLPA